MYLKIELMNGMSQVSKKMLVYFHIIFYTLAVVMCNVYRLVAIATLCDYDLK